MKTSQDLAMARLAAADPFAESRFLKDWSKADDDALLESLRAQTDRPELEQPLPLESLSERQSRLKRPVVLALIAVAAGAVAFGLLFGTSSAPSAFAQWSPTTTSVPATQLAAAQSDCQHVWSRSVHLIPPAVGIPPAIGSGLSGSIPPLVLTDSRGPFELLFFAGSSGESVCLWRDRVIGDSITNGLTGLPPSSNQSIGIPGVGFSSVRGAPYTYAIGRAGPGVTGVALELAGGTSVETALQNGFYGAWWPTKSDVESAQVTTTTGTSRENLGDVGPNNNGPPYQPSSLGDQIGK
jgi:hypothetical protein